MQLVATALSSVLLLLAVAYLTLFERQLLSLSQNRLSPNKVGWGGVTQPLVDGLNLLNQETLLPNKGEGNVLLISSYSALGVIFLSFSLLPQSFQVLNLGSGGLVLLVLLSALLYNLLLVSLLSASNYSGLGSLRFVVSSLSFESVFMLILLDIIKLVESLNLTGLILFLLTPFSWALIFLVILYEMHRGPLEFPESESELVSGFNTELSSLPFVFVFLSEYGFLTFFSGLIGCWLWGGSHLAQILLLTAVVGIRAWYPRYRYDKGLSLSWLVLVPLLTLHMAVLIVHPI